MKERVSKMCQTLKAIMMQADKIIVICAILCGLYGCITVPQDNLAGPYCEVHNVRLQVGVAPVLYGLIASSINNAETNACFIPSYSRGYVLGGCIVSEDAPAFAPVLYCPECRRADPTWKEEVQRLWRQAAPNKINPSSAPSLVDVEVFFIGISTQMATTMTVNNDLSASVLFALVREGRANLLSAPRLKGQSGREISLRVVKEVIYPTTFEENLAKGTNDMVNGGLSGLSIIPNSFETREIGTIFTVMPKVFPDSDNIELEITPSLVSEPEWKDFSQNHLRPDGNKYYSPIQQPFFNTITFNTKTMVKHDMPVLLGGGTPTMDQKGFVYIVLRATIVNPDGTTEKKQTGNVQDMSR